MPYVQSDRRPLIVKEEPTKFPAHLFSYRDTFRHCLDADMLGAWGLVLCDEHEALIQWVRERGIEPPAFFSPPDGSPRAR